MAALYPENAPEYDRSRYGIARQNLWPDAKRQRRDSVRMVYQALRMGYEAAYPAIETFLIDVGRRKFLVPLYQEMMNNEAAKPGSSGGKSLALRNL
ncbi:MAG: leukotriene A4 hydrolase C-terminal domain-containing protein [Bacteroidia bacterium]